MTPTEKDAMALAVLDKAATWRGDFMHDFASSAELREARTHLASRIAELEETREVLFGGLDRDRDNITTRNLAVVAINALARERDRATRAETELERCADLLAATQQNEDAALTELAAVKSALPTEIHERGEFERGYNAAIRNFSAAVDAARGGVK